MIANARRGAFVRLGRWSISLEHLRLAGPAEHERIIE
jgi:hypothetical protein